jgi:hypothetical protein
MPSITAVEGDTLLTLTFQLTDARNFINLNAASSITLTHHGNVTHTLTPLPTPGYCTFVAPASFTSTPGHFPAEILVTLDTNTQFFPSESPIFVEILPHSRARA